MKRKLKLNRVTLHSLDAAGLTAAQGGATERGSCAPCPSQYITCALSCWGTCFNHTCVPAICEL